MNIEQGLFQFDLIDHHAILGVSLEADAKAIRKRYLKIARKLHPDSLRDCTDEERQKANELLSKMVNPAYETLTQEKAMTEHLIVLRLRGRRLSQSASVPLQSEAAQTIAKSNNAVSAYTNGLKTLADTQYEAIDQVLNVIGEISELNLAYLMSTAGESGGATAGSSSSTNTTATTSAKPTAARSRQKVAAPPPSPRQQREAIIDSYHKRAAEFAARKDYSRAILEMRDAVKSHPTNGQCHAQLAAYYLQAGQSKMAKIHLKRALEFTPDNALAKELEAKLSMTTEPKTTRTPSAKSAKSAPAKAKGGLFGLFGGKQK